jgi:inner membrane protein
LENLSHSLIGAVLAETALPNDATRSQRTLFYVTGIIAANLPDADLLYTSITPPPLGYLLHHRGHTHTVVGLVALAALIGIVSLIPALRRLIRSAERRYWLLVFAALGSHLLADSWNSYGVHPFWPLTNRWYYGDAVYILEPWLWTLLGVSVAMNTRGNRGRLILSGALIAIPIAAAATGLIAPLALVPIALAGALFVAVFRSRPARARAQASLAAAALFVLGSIAIGSGVRLVVKSEATRAPYRHFVDAALNPRPGNPLCWSALVVERAGDSLYTKRGMIDVARRLSPVGACGRRESDGWTPVATQSVNALRSAMTEDCRVRAWLQFGRVPVLEAGWISDARFGGTGRGNFTAMEVADIGSVSDCPTHLTHWDLPRADVLSGPSPPPYAP